ncbi:MAG: FIST C-terminal domain-containing protein [Verrucomicrobia bacterium]|nr:FIST C-terminal domain-containing protein [Verrucomicrobiota bacterium]
MKNGFSTAGLWAGNADLREIAAWAKALRQEIRPAAVDLGLIFISPRFFEAAQDILRCVRSSAEIPILLGCSSNSLIVGQEEIEEGSGISLGLYSLPGAALSAVRFTQSQVEEWNGAGYWRMETGMSPEKMTGWLAFADPFSLDAERWLKQWDDAFAGIPILGGMASGDYAARKTHVYFNEQVHEDGGVALALSGAVALAGIISQGCTPIGETWTITKAESNVILEIANRPAYQVLVETVSALPSAEQARTRGNLFIGLVMDEYRDEFQRGDFLIRNILEADAETGAIAIGALPRPGQTMQFQRRDAEASSEDMTVLLRRAQNELAGRRVLGGCLCSCNGRGRRLFGPIHHDASQVQQAFGPMGLAGFFCNGEIGPVSGHNFLHGYTASLALFVEEAPGK